MKALLTFLLTLSCISLSAQTDSVEFSTPKTSFIAGASYSSPLHYYGRTDSLKSRGLYSFAGVNLKNGLYLLSTVIAVSNELSTQYAATTVEAGYRFSNKKENWSGHIFASKYFYNDDIRLVQSAVKTQTGINLSNINKVLGLHFGVDAKFSNNIDLGAFARLDRIFRIENIAGGVLAINPAVNVYGGTQRFSKSYLQQKKLFLLPVAEEEVTRESSSFQILSYEISTAIVFGIRKMQIIFIPAYVLPRNLIASQENANPFEPAKSLFCTTTAVRFTF